MLGYIDSPTSYQLSWEFRSTQERVFELFFDEATLKRIWGVSEITIDGQPGGKTRAKLQLGEENWDFTITYTAIVPHEKIAWTVEFDRSPGKKINVTLWFVKLLDATKFTVRQENFSNEQERNESRKAWEGCMKTIETLL